MNASHEIRYVIWNILGWVIITDPTPRYELDSFQAIGRGVIALFALVMSTYHAFKWYTTRDP